MSAADTWISDVVATLPALATVPEACSALRTSPRNLRRMIADGRLRALRATETGSSRVLIPRREVERFLTLLDGGTS